MRNRMYGGVRGRKTKVGGKPTFVFLLLDCSRLIVELRSSRLEQIRPVCDDAVKIVGVILLRGLQSPDLHLFAKGVHA